MITREQHMIGTAVSGVIAALNAPYCKGPGEAVEAVNADHDYLANVAKVIANLSSRMQVECAIEVLKAAAERFG